MDPALAPTTIGVVGLFLGIVGVGRLRASVVLAGAAACGVAGALWAFAHEPATGLCFGACAAALALTVSNPKEGEAHMPGGWPSMVRNADERM